MAAHSFLGFGNRPNAVLEVLETNVQEPTWRINEVESDNADHGLHVRHLGEGVPLDGALREIVEAVPPDWTPVEYSVISRRESHVPGMRNLLLDGGSWKFGVFTMATARVFLQKQIERDAVAVYITFRE